MSSSDFPNISDLPPEVLAKVFKHLKTYTELQAVRPTCKQFNETAAAVQREGLYNMSIKTDKVSAKFVACDWLKTTHTNTEGLLEYSKRLTRGAGSLMVLSSMVRTANALSIHLIRAGVLPPLPGVVLDEVKTAVHFASRRNPLVGKNRLKQIYKDIVAYFRSNRVLSTTELPVTVMLRTVVSLLECLPKAKDERFVHDQGQIKYTRTLQPTPITGTRGEEVPSDVDLLLGTLLQLGMHAASRYVMTEQASVVISEDISQLEHFVTDVHLTVRGQLQGDSQPLGLRRVRTLCDLQQENPTGFSVAIVGFSIPRNEDVLQGVAIEEFSPSYTFGSLNV